MSKNIKTASLVLLLACGFSQSFSQGYDTTRIYRAMAKARRGEPINIVVLGGSITQGSLASSESNRWVNIMTEWWRTKFPLSKDKITLINSGIGGTGSDIGVHRLQRDVFSFDPDFVTVEFSVNDAGVSTAEQTMEGLIRQLVSNDSTPGVMMLLLKMENGQTAKELHKPVGIKYKVPMVCFADSIGARVLKDGKTLAQTYGDNGTNHDGANGVHPNDLGMSYIANYMIAELERIYATLPADADIKTPDKTLSTPITSTQFDNTYLYSPLNLVPIQNSGWKVGTSNWTSSTVDSQIDFEVDGNTISLMYTNYYASYRGQVQAWVDNGTPKTLDAYFTETWGTATKFAIIGSGLADSKHILHIKVLGTNSQSNPTGHYFELVNVLKAGNISIIAPIAKANVVPSILLNGNSINLDGSKSFDPQGKKVTSFNWFIISKPATSTALISASTDTITTFKPDVNGNYEIGLKVYNGSDSSAFSRLTFNVRNTNGIPIAVPGNDSTIATKIKVTLNGLQSNDPENDPLTYQWSIQSQPSSSYISLDNALISNPSFTPVIPGEYIISLIVSDPLNSSTIQTVKFTAINGFVKSDIVDGIYQVAISPNPVNTIGTISYSLFEKTQVNIGLYSIAGSKITDLINETQEQGEHHLSVNVKSIVPSGIYFLKVQTSNGIITKKIVLE